MVPSEMFGDPAKMAQLMAMIGALGRPQKIITTEACLDFLASSSAVKPGLYGSTGYCMGGQTSLIAAGAFPNRFAVNASFHGGRLATDEPDSPHNFASAMTGYVYVAGAVQDQFFDLLLSRATAVMTNVPGPQWELRLAGAPVRQVIFWVPQSGSIGMGVSILTYNGQVQFGLITDTALVPDPDQVICRFGTEFENLLLHVLMTA